mmetsp:Transcript_46402/g.123041  ORF Transcript_46402/g.123041 Transcript_46402/m.123041 type:complete len:163 (-) Transcript_46402:129-617(-)
MGQDFAIDAVERFGLPRYACTTEWPCALNPSRSLTLYACLGEEEMDECIGRGEVQIASSAACPGRKRWVRPALPLATLLKFSRAGYRVVMVHTLFCKTIIYGAKLIMNPMAISDMCVQVDRLLEHSVHVGHVGAGSASGRISTRIQCTNEPSTAMVRVKPKN